MKNRTVSEEKNKPVLNEDSLAKLLEAAFVLQEHNREMQELELRLDLKRDQVEAEERAREVEHPIPDPKTTEPAPAAPDYTLILGRIVETQHHIQIRRLDLESALKLVAERVLEMGRGSGAAVGVLEGRTVRYRAVAGQSTPGLGSAVVMDKSMLVPCMKTGQVLRCADTHAEFLLDADECKRRGIQSLIAVPIFHDGKVVGGLELYYSSANAFREQDVHTCQLMAGLVTEALAREEEATWKKSVASERAALLETLEKLRPSLAALVERPTVNRVPSAEPVPNSGRSYSCRKCGHQLTADEQFCGQCGAPRASDYEAPNMQSKVASLWQMQELQKKGDETDDENTHTSSANEQVNSDSPLLHSLQHHVPELFSAPDLESSEANEIAEPPSPLPPKEIGIVEDAGVDDLDTMEEESTEEPQPSQALAKTKLTHSADWSSAANAREFLEELAGAKQQNAVVRFWNSRRGDIYLAIAVILVACVIRWGIWSDHSVGATGSPSAAATQRKAPADAGLSFFDRVLVQLGLAEPPETPEDKGNPGVQVWIDLHTALYYCPGADLYGKTPKGKFATQREAQMDQFEPAYRKACN